jgi:hypothetical protein
MAYHLYIWRSEAVRAYGLGTVAAVAMSPEVARVMAFTALLAWAHEHRSWWFSEDGTVHPESGEEYGEFCKTAERDLAATPTVRQSLVVAGSE